MSIFAAHESEQTELETDVAIVGAGAAGLILASSITRKVTVIESGNFRMDPARDLEFRPLLSGEPLDLEYPRIRLIGGATALWTGRCTELDPIDFEKRPGISHSGWPISGANLRYWYDLAWAFMVKPQDPALSHYDNAILKTWLQNSSVLRRHLWRFALTKPGSPRRPGKELLSAFEGDQKDLIYNADCIGFETRDRAVKTVCLLDRRGRTIRLKAKEVVLASGCLEANRLLLSEARAHPELLGLTHHWLGRGFHQHLRVDCGQVVAGSRNMMRLQRTLNLFKHPANGYEEVGLAFRQSYLRKRELANASMILRYSPSPLSALGSPQIAWSKLRHRESIFHFARARVEADIEQAIDPDSRIILSDSRDCNGQPKAEVRWKINDLERRTAVEMIHAINAWLGGTNLGQVCGHEAVREDFIEPSRLKDSLHHFGGTRMSASSADGVVDQNLKLHGTENLWVVGGSVFPTGGHANPTLTIIALALRLAHHLDSLSPPMKTAPRTQELPLPEYAQSNGGTQSLSTSIG